ncbi:restriction endonuclease [Bacillus sp. FJAT-44742]|uniref:restriction endonuclease n=1 Tax=Bacillus sp. FJAT-44742 TaxID=2014005 RepID=UPI001E529BB8|nr:restriction endonuclease [Bacillus sp. FJAT-44742]
MNDPLDRPTLDQLIGTMSNFGADFGLLISWSGFKNSVMREVPKQFFKVRLWDSKTVIEEIFKNYEHLSDEIKKEIPIKRVWMLEEDND